MTRPKRGACLWVRLTFKKEDGGGVIEGTIENDLLNLKPWESIEIACESPGTRKIPIWTFSSETIEACEVLGVCGARELVKNAK